MARTGRKIKKAKAVPSTLAKPLASRDVNLRVDPTTPYVAAADTKKRLDLSVITPKPSAELVKVYMSYVPIYMCVYIYMYVHFRFIWLCGVCVGMYFLHACMF